MTASWHAVGVFCGIALGPLIGIPVAPFYVAAGAVWQSTALFWVGLAVAIDISIAYSISGWIRPALERRLARFRFPTASEMGPWKLVLLTRFMPGLPMAAQNYFLGLSRTPFFIYFVGSLAAQLIWAAGFMIAGDSWAHSRWFGVATGVCLVLLLVLVTRAYLRRR